MLNDNQSIGKLIKYYQTLININEEFGNVHGITITNDDYKGLVEKLISIEQLLINQTTANINSIYKPLEKLFIHEEHYILLENVIQFYKQNFDAIYPISEDKDIGEIKGYHHVENNDDETLELQQNLVHQQDTIINLLNHHFENIYSQLSDVTNNTSSSANIEILSTLSEIKESILVLNNNDSHQVIKSSESILATLNTNHELMKADLNKYDSLLTHHINQTSQITLESIEKEHSRFAQKIASDSRAIIENITESNITELEKQTKFIQSSVNLLNDKTFYQSCYLFFWSIFILFGCSILSSNWTATKILNNVKLARIIEAPAPKLNIHKKASN